MTVRKLLGKNQDKAFKLCKNLAKTQTNVNFTCFLNFW